jgi:hypothetical protein
MWAMDEMPRRAFPNGAFGSDVLVAFVARAIQGEMDC